MTALERLRAAIDRQQTRLRADVPPDREAAILALLRARDRLPRTPGRETTPDLVTGRRLDDLGGDKALALCLEADPSCVGVSCVGGGRDDPDAWSARFLEECAHLAEAELVLAHAETGFMLLVDDGHGTFDAWIATKRLPTTWRERADVDWWAGRLSRQHEPELRALESARPAPDAGNAEQDAYYRRLAGVHLETMGYQLGYPSDAAIDGCTIQAYRDVLGWLIAWALRAHNRGEALAPRSEPALTAEIAAALGGDVAAIRRAVAAFTLDREGAAYHAAVPGVAAAPLVRIGPDRVVVSVYGLTTEPLLFLIRELRRRAGQAYHNTAHLREGIFRRDLYALFGDRRFVTSAGRIELRRAAGDVRTDIDAVVFDRKSGTLGLFELKSQDPFARSTAELARQRDNVLYANRQVSGVLTWLQRHGANELLARVDARTAKTFRAQKVYPFVLGRYLAHFGDGPDPDRRAAWGTWPQLLRLLDAQPIRAADANPLASLFARLTKDVPHVGPPAADDPPREIDLGTARLVVHPSYAALQARAASPSGRG
jgi:hypothetical protein